MRCPFQEGDFPFPVKYGYAAVGIVEAGPAEWLGREVFVLHPHQTRFLAPLAIVLATGAGFFVYRSQPSTAPQSSLIGAVRETERLVAKVIAVDDFDPDEVKPHYAPGDNARAVLERRETVQQQPAEMHAAQ